MLQFDEVPSLGENKQNYLLVALIYLGHVAINERGYIRTSPFFQRTPTVMPRHVLVPVSTFLKNTCYQIFTGYRIDCWLLSFLLYLRRYLPSACLSLFYIVRLLLNWWSVMDYQPNWSQINILSSALFIEFYCSLVSMIGSQDFLFLSFSCFHTFLKHKFVLTSSAMNCYTPP